VSTRHDKHFVDFLNSQYAAKRGATKSGRQYLASHCSEQHTDAALLSTRVVVMNCGGNGRLWGAGEPCWGQPHQKRTKVAACSDTTNRTCKSSSPRADEEEDIPSLFLPGSSARAYTQSAASSSKSGLSAALARLPWLSNLPNCFTAARAPFAYDARTGSDLTRPNSCPPCTPTTGQHHPPHPLTKQHGEHQG
jgi:hypothetical protein